MPNDLLPSTPSQVGRGFALASICVTLMGPPLFVVLLAYGGRFGTFMLWVIFGLVSLILGGVGLVLSVRRGSGKGYSIVAILLATAFLLVPLAFLYALTEPARRINAEQEQARAEQDKEWAIELAKQAPQKIGATVQAPDGDFVFVVRSFTCGTTRSGVDNQRRPAVGRFCAADLKVSNSDTQPRLFTPELVEARSLLPLPHKADPAASVSANRDPKVFSRKIPPGKSIEATVLFFVPTTAQIDILEFSSVDGHHVARVDVKSATPSRLP